MKRVAFFVICVMACTMMTVLAEEAPSYSMDILNGVVSVTVRGEAQLQDGTEKAVSIHVLRPGKSYEADDPNLFETVAYAAETMTEQGAYRFTFQLEQSGTYMAYIGGIGAEKIPLEIAYVDYEENRKAIEALNAAAKESYEAFAAVFEQEKTDLAFHLPLYDDVTGSEVIERLYNTVKEQPLDPENGTAAVKLFEQATILVALNEGKLDSIHPYREVMDITTGEMKDWYGKSIVTSDMVAAVTDRLSGRNIADMDEFADLFQEALVLEIIHSPGGTANVKAIIEEFASEIGVSTAGVSDSVYRGLAGNSYNDYGALKSAFQSADTTRTPSRGGGGGGGSSSSGGGSDAVIGFPGNQTQPVDTVPPANTQFVDLDSVPWATEAIVALAERGIVAGRTVDTYAPGDVVKREEFVKLLVTLFGLEADGSAIPFTDVQEGDWFYPYVAAAYQHGLCSGVSATEFGSGQPIRRQDIAVMVDNAMQTLGLSLAQRREPAEFTDAAEIAAYAAQSVERLYCAEIINGDDNRAFLPVNSATRAEAAVIVYHLVSYVEQED